MAITSIQLDQHGRMRTRTGGVKTARISFDDKNRVHNANRFSGSARLNTVGGLVGDFQNQIDQLVNKVNEYDKRIELLYEFDKDGNRTLKQGQEIKLKRLMTQREQAIETARVQQERGEQVARQRLADQEDTMAALQAEEDARQERIELNRTNEVRSRVGLGPLASLAIPTQQQD